VSIAHEPGRLHEMRSRMLEILNSFLTVQALHVAAELSIADLLAEGPVTVADLAAATGAHPPSLYRLLRMLTGAGVFREEPDGRFALAALGATLRSEGLDSVRDWALLVGAPEAWGGFGRLYDTVMTGRPGFEIAHGVPVYEYMARNPKVGAPFDRWMTRQSDQHNGAVVAAYDFSPFRIIADIGGGQGATLAAILRANPALHGILFDQPQVVANAIPLETADVAGRCRIVAGDMLQGVPHGADAYLVKRVLMIWDDRQSVRVLRNCADALSRGGKVLVVEMVMPQGNDPSPAKVFDLLMMIQHHGRIRTETEFRGLFADAGLRLTQVIPTASPNSILEGVLA
jgi:DNA-binding transcriptional ArsR family regulator